MPQRRIPLQNKYYLGIKVKGAKHFFRNDLREHDQPEGFSLEMKSNVKPEVPGVYTVEYRVTRQDEAGNNSVTGYAKLIVVVEG